MRFFLFAACPADIYIYIYTYAMNTAVIRSAEVGDVRCVFEQLIAVSHENFVFISQNEQEKASPFPPWDFPFEQQKAAPLGGGGGLSFGTSPLRLPLCRVY